MTHQGFFVLADAQAAVADSPAVADCTRGGIADLRRVTASR